MQVDPSDAQRGDRDRGRRARSPGLRRGRSGRWCDPQPEQVQRTFASASHERTRPGDLERLEGQHAVGLPVEAAQLEGLQGRECRAVFEREIAHPHIELRSIGLERDQHAHEALTPAVRELGRDPERLDPRTELRERQAFRAVADGERGPIILVQDVAAEGDILDDARSAQVEGVLGVRSLGGRPVEAQELATELELELRRARFEVPQARARVLDREQVEHEREGLARRASCARCRDLRGRGGRGRTRPGETRDADASAGIAHHVHARLHDAHRGKLDASAAEGAQGDGEFREAGDGLAIGCHVDGAHGEPAAAARLVVAGRLESRAEAAASIDALSRRIDAERRETARERTGTQAFDAPVELERRGAQSARGATFDAQRVDELRTRGPQLEACVAADVRRGGVERQLDLQRGGDAAIGAAQLDARRAHLAHDERQAQVEGLRLARFGLARWRRAAGTEPLEPVDPTLLVDLDARAQAVDLDALDRRRPSQRVEQREVRFEEVQLEGGFCRVGLAEHEAVQAYFTQEQRELELLVLALEPQGARHGVERVGLRQRERRAQREQNERDAQGDAPCARATQRRQTFSEGHCVPPARSSAASRDGSSPKGS